LVPVTSIAALSIGNGNMARLMALDVGEARIGVAVSDTTGFLASPYTTLHVSCNEQQNWDMIQKLLEETEAEGIVIGLPISLDGQIHAQGRRVQSFAARLLPHVSVPLIFWDERFSTVEAERLRASLTGQSQDSFPTTRPRRTSRSGEKHQRQAGRGHRQSKRRQRGHEIDALAATVILQAYLSQDSGMNREHKENQVSLPEPPDEDKSNRTIPDMSNGFVPGSTAEDKRV
jgi:putative holliday junction resolvase